MSDNDLAQIKANLVSEQDDIEFELFAVQQGVAPEAQASLQLRSAAVSARLRTVDGMLELRARAAIVPIRRVSSMSRNEVNSEFDALMGSNGLL